MSPGARLLGWLGLGAALAAPGGAGAVLSASDLEYLQREARAWIDELRAAHRPRGRELTPGERRRLAPFFPREVIASARLALVRGIDNPGFYEFFHRRGEPDPIDFSRMTGLAAGDTVLIVRSRAEPSSRCWLALLFHELVHVTQRHVLRERYLDDYVAGWAATRSYRAIPFEEQAYELAARFAARPTEIFAVEGEVKARFERGEDP